MNQTVADITPCFLCGAKSTNAIFQFRPKLADQPRVHASIGMARFFLCPLCGDCACQPDVERKAIEKIFHMFSDVRKAAESN